MTLVLGALGWGLLAIGAVTHVWHHQRLRDLLGMHLDQEKAAATALVAVEVVLAIALPVAVLADAPWRVVAAVAAAVLGLAFTIWIARLLATGSELPCACSFSSEPTSRWSLVRAVATIAAGVLAVAGIDELATVERSMGLVAGLALAGALFVLPEALSWPAPSRAQLARIESHRPSS